MKLAAAAQAAIMSAGVLRLSPKQIQTIAGFICGGDDPWPYRRMVDIVGFVRFTGVEIAHDVEVGSRFVSACAFVEEADEREQAGHSGLRRDTEKVLEALLDRREFDTDEQHRAAVQSVRDTLVGLPLKVMADDTGKIEIRSTCRDRARRLLDEQIHTAFGDVLSNEDLASARRHYGKAKGFLEAREPDYENACKASVCTLESLATAADGDQEGSASWADTAAVGRHDHQDLRLSRQRAWRGARSGGRPYSPSRRSRVPLRLGSRTRALPPCRTDR